MAQEALTNVAATPRRPASPWPRYESDGTRLVVEDFRANGTARDADAEPDGYGLTGMRERAELLGGTLAAGATDHGFRVELAGPA